MNALWRPGPARPSAPCGEVHVWRADLDDASRNADALAWLCSGEERQRAADMRDPGARRRFVVRRALHRVLLGGYAVGSSRLELQTATSSLGPVALFAFGRSQGLGLSIVPIPDRDPSSSRIPGLNNRERLAIHRLPEQDRGRTTCAVLAAKDALGCARGRGLDRRIEEVDLLPAVAPAVRGGTFSADVDGLLWSGAVFELPDDRIACVVHDGGPRALRSWELGR